MNLIVSVLAQFLATWVQTAFAPLLVVFPSHRAAISLSWSEWLICMSAAALLLLIRTVSIGLRHNGAFSERVLILGTSPLVETLIDEIERSSGCRYNVIGVVDDSPGGRLASRISLCLGPIER